MHDTTEQRLREDIGGLCRPRVQQWTDEDDFTFEQRTPRDIHLCSPRSLSTHCSSPQTLKTTTQQIEIFRFPWRFTIWLQEFSPFCFGFALLSFSISKMTVITEKPWLHSWISCCVLLYGRLPNKVMSFDFLKAILGKQIGLYQRQSPYLQVTFIYSIYSLYCIYYTVRA